MEPRGGRKGLQGPPVHRSPNARGRGETCDVSISRLRPSRCQPIPRSLDASHIGRVDEIGRRQRVYRSIGALAIALALIRAPGVGPQRDASVDAASTCIKFIAARFDASGVDAQNLNGEWVTIKNSCTKTVSLYGWKIRDRDRHTYGFRSGRKISAGAAIKVHSGKGAGTARHVYMGRSTVMWNNRSWERAYLYNPAGARVSIWPRTSIPAPAPPPPTTTTSTAWSVPFLSRPNSGAIRRTGNCDNLVIQNRTFKDLGADVEAIHLENCHNVTIRANDFARVAQGITVLRSTNVRIEWNRYLDIKGPHERVGKHRANFVQLVEVSRGRIYHNKGKGGDTEDIVSMYHSGGTSTSPFIVDHNQFEGTNWTSSSGSGDRAWRRVVGLLHRPQQHAPECRAGRPVHRRWDAPQDPGQHHLRRATRQFERRRVRLEPVGQRLFGSRGLRKSGQVAQ